MIDPKRVARELAKEIVAAMVTDLNFDLLDFWPGERPRAELENKLTKTIEARISAEYQRHIENIEIVTGKKAGA